MKTIYLAGGCYWGVEKYVSLIKGVKETTVGFANGNTENPSYEEVKHQNTGHAETVKVSFDEKELPLTALLNLFYEIIDPVSVDRQGEDIGHQYRTGIYYTDPEDEKVVRESLSRLEKRLGQKLAVEACPLDKFFSAEEYHQKYLDKNPGGYCHVPLAKMQWVKGIDPKDYED